MHSINTYLYRDRYICLERVEYHGAQDVQQGRTWNRPYMNNAFTVFFVTQGSLGALIEGANYDLRSGEICILDCLEACLLTPAAYPVVFYRLSFSPYYFRVLDPTGLLCHPFEKRSHGVGNRIPGTAFDAQGLRACLVALEAQESPAQRRLSLIVHLVALLYSMNQAFPWDMEDKRPPEVRRVLSYIAEHGFEDVELTTLAAGLYLSRSQLSTLIKKSTGYATWDYVLHKRIYRSIRLLHQGMSNRQAAQAVGFRDYSAFYKAFHKIAGHTPTSEHPDEASDPLLARFYEVELE